MANKDRLQGTLDLLILKTLAVRGTAHGYAIAAHIDRISDALVQVEEGSLYPALHRLERKRWLASKWERPKGGNREFKYYRLTPAGRKQLHAELSKWRRLVISIGRVIELAEEG